MSVSRRDFLAVGASTILAGSLASAAPAKVKLKKAVKLSMVKAPSVLDQFKLVKQCGFLGVEVDSPNTLKNADLLKARDETGIVIHGTIDSIHWNKRLSDPKPEVREQGLNGLKTALNDAKVLGADTCLLVPGAVRNKETENFDQCWERSTEEVKKVLPLAEKLNIKIAIEVVWNEFLTTPELLIKYVDQFASPWLGAYFDCSNMIKYGVPSAEWIRRLGKRMLKLDFKGYHYETKKWVDIGQGTENWPDILKACEEVGYHSWATAEVSGGGEKELMAISAKMDKILELN